LQYILFFNFKFVFLFTGNNLFSYPVICLFNGNGGVYATTFSLVDSGNENGTDRIQIIHVVNCMQTADHILNFNSDRYVPEIVACLIYTGTGG